MKKKNRYDTPVMVGVIICLPFFLNGCHLHIHLKETHIHREYKIRDILAGDVDVIEEGKSALVEIINELSPAE